MAGPHPRARGVEPETVCPGCGLRLPPADWPLPDGYSASRECFQRFGELSSYTLALGDAAFSHQYAVDAYAAQHAGEAATAIRVFFALVGLHLAFERGFTGREVQRAHQLLARRRREWPRFEPPRRPGDATVQDVLAAAAGSPRDAVLREWARCVWEAWRAEHARVRELVHQWLPGAESVRGRQPGR